VLAQHLGCLEFSPGALVSLHASHQPVPSASRRSISFVS
jgi:hypothetical protein